MRKAPEHYGTRLSYARMEVSGDRYTLNNGETDFIQTRDSFYTATEGENGWPYVQFRGGPQGFLAAIDDTNLGYAHFRHSRRYISTGNMHASSEAALMLMDHPARQRLRIWVESTSVAADQDA